MTITFTRGADSFSPAARGLFEATQEAGTVEHVHLDGSVGYSLTPDRPRSGEFPLFFLSAAEAESARVLLSEAGPWVVVDDTVGVSMTLVRKGRLGQVQQPSKTRWMLHVGFAEVLS